jgi:hypothetical protein
MTILALVVVCSLSFEAALSVGHPPRETAFFLQQSFFYSIMIYFGAKFSFAVFSLRECGLFKSCGHSWFLTSRKSFWPTLLVIGAFYTMGFLITAGVWTLHGKLTPGAWAVLRVALYYTYAILTWPFIYLLMARWMVKCERLKSSSATVPPRTPF